MSTDRITKNTRLLKRKLDTYHVYSEPFIQAQNAKNLKQ